MKKPVISLILTLLISSNVYGQPTCKDPNIRSTIEAKYMEIGATHPDFLQDANIILKRSSFQKIQWVGLYWEGPVSGALLTYDCQGKLLSIQQTGGVKSVEFFNAPSAANPAVAVEEIWAGTGYYKAGFSIFSAGAGKIKKLFEHTKLERNFVVPSEDGVVDSFEIAPTGSAEQGWKKLNVEGVRKIYPSSKYDYSDFRVEKLPIETYCWSNERGGYSLCK